MNARAKQTVKKRLRTSSNMQVAQTLKDLSNHDIAFVVDVT